MGGYKKKSKSNSSGIDGVTPTDFSTNLTVNIERINRSLVAGSYQFQRLRCQPIPKSNSDKMRIICIPTVRDRLVQRLIVRYLDRGDKLGIINPVSHAFIKDQNRSVVSAVRQAIKYRGRYPFVFKSDISAFFDQIQRNELIEKLNRKLGTVSIIPLLRGAISSELLIRNSKDKNALEGTDIVEGIGLRQGMPLSPILSNFVLKNLINISIGKT